MTPDLLDHYLAAWRLADPQLLAKTPTSHVYTVMYQGETAVLKLLTPVGVQDEQCGAAALRHYNGRGAVRLLRGDDQAHLLEYAEGGDLVPLVARGDDEQATHIIAGVVRQLHAEPASGEGLIPLRRRFRSLFRQAERDQSQGDGSIFVRGAQIAEALLADPREVRVLHGDLHHANIRHSARRGWLAFDPKGVYGERTYDLANVLCNPGGLSALVEDEGRLVHHAGILAEQLEIERGRILTYVFAYACLSTCWSAEDGQDPTHDLRMAVLAEPHARTG